MENLLKPDIGLMFWTAITFLITVLILKKIAWGPLLKTIEEREERIKGEIDAAEKNRTEMERMKGEYERQLGEIEARARALLTEAEQKGSEARDSILKEAESEAKKLADKTRKQLEIEKDRLIGELRSEVGELSVSIAEKLMRETVNKKVQDKIVQDFLDNVHTPSDKVH